jgi:hypothetical protein
VLRHVPYRLRDERPGVLANGAQADLDREFGTVASKREQLESRAHGTHASIAREAFAVTDVTVAEAREQQALDWLSDELIGRMAEERRHLVIREDDDAGRVDDDHGVRRRIEHAPDELGRQHRL